jgi:hypothetical protein
MKMMQKQCFYKERGSERELERGEGKWEKVRERGCEREREKYTYFHCQHRATV